MNAIAFDKQEQVQKVQVGLIPGETLVAVYDCKGSGTGFAVLTDKRVVLQDNAFIGKTLAITLAITSLPFRSVSTVHFVTDRSLLGKLYSSSTVAITTAGGTVHECEFRDDNKAKHFHDYVLWAITA